ncbi:hypothetical protein BU26DRAFT_56084 [Trematosphaeria pertusa]|uniref:Uncharacterized protein n=1 Tax=Trematosphaeria pertusa TaxID=390896 RepID=A0A6A6I8R0_9PLEO|nr:uncharacterized protein BU26DRAFT_56084 [Trematosphaeria pertusa]KAF2246955.1 hypothetical protein BU26DRAFT_56084 [Trematosphaeria pertusa]
MRRGARLLAGRQITRKCARSVDCGLVSSRFCGVMERKMHRSQRYHRTRCLVRPDRLRVFTGRPCATASPTRTCPALAGQSGVARLAPGHTGRLLHHSRIAFKRWLTFDRLQPTTASLPAPCANGVWAAQAINRHPGAATPLPKVRSASWANMPVGKPVPASLRSL